MDGFFLTGREVDPDFSWSSLEGAEVLVHHGGQPMTMFKYACHKAGIDISRIKMIDAGNAKEMDAAFREGRGQYIHQQGPARNNSKPMVSALSWPRSARWLGLARFPASRPCPNGL